MGYHYVPQKYLSRFADEAVPEAIWLYDKRGGVPKRIGIPAVAQSRDFYSSDDEAKLAQIVEGPTDPAISKLLRHEALLDRERLQLSFYIATMFRRVPYQRRRVYETIVPPVLDKIFSEMRTDLVRAAEALSVDPLFLTYRAAQLAAQEERVRQQPPDQIHAAVRSPWPTEKEVVAVYDLAWRVLSTAGPVRYITSDNPAFYFSEYGIGTEHSEIMFPLSTSHCLHGSKQGPRAGLAFLEAWQEFVDEANHRLASTSERFGFYHEEVMWLQPLLQQREYKLNRIQW
jgi:hypothetical protein